MLRNIKKTRLIEVMVPATIGDDHPYIEAIRAAGEELGMFSQFQIRPERLGPHHPKADALIVQWLRGNDELVRVLGNIGRSRADTPADACIHDPYALADLF